MLSVRLYDATSRQTCKPSGRTDSCLRALCSFHFTSLWKRRNSFRSFSVRICVPTDSRSIQSLIQCLQRQSPPPLCLSSLSSAATLVHETRQATFRPRHCIFRSSLNRRVRERRTEFQLHKHIVRRIADRRQNRMENIREERDERKRLAGVALHSGSFATRRGFRGADI